MKEADKMMQNRVMFPACVLYSLSLPYAKIHVISLNKLPPSTFQIILGTRADGRTDGRTYVSLS